MVFTKKKEQPEDSTFAKLNESSESFDFDMDEPSLVRGRETSDGTAKSPVEEKRRSRSRSAVRKLANVFSTGNKHSAASEDRLHGERAMEDDHDKSGGFVPPPTFGGMSPSKSNGGETEQTAEEMDNSDKASSNGSNSGAQTFEMPEMPIKSPPKGRRRWRSRSRTRTLLDQKLESDSELAKQANNDDDDESSHHGSVVASVVSMFEYISPRRGQAKKLSVESPAKLMESPSSPKTEKKGIRSWIPKSPGRRAKEAAAEEAQTKDEEETEDQLRPSVLAAPSKANLDIELNLMNDEQTSGGDELNHASSPRRTSQNRSARQSVMHRRRGSRGPERRRSSHEQAEHHDIGRDELEDLNSSQVSLLETGSVVTAEDTVVTTVTSCSEVVALPPQAKGFKTSRHSEDPPESRQRRRVVPDPSCESLQSILKVNKYSSGAGNKELKEPKSPKSPRLPRSPGTINNSHREVSRSRSKSEHGTRSSGSLKSAGDAVSRSKDVSPAKKSRNGARSSSRSEQGEEVRRRGRSRRPSEGGARRSSIASAQAPVKSPKPEGRRKSFGSRPDDPPSHSPPLRSSRHSNARPSSRGRVHRRPSGHGGTALSSSDGHRTREPSSSRTSQGRNSLHARRPSRTPNGRRKTLAAAEGKNLHAAPLVPELNKELSKEAKREIMDDIKHRGHEEGGKMPTHNRHRSKSRHRRSSSKGSRKKVESSHCGEGHTVKVKVVKKHRPKEHDNEAAQLQIKDGSESILDVEYNTVAEVST